MQHKQPPILKAIPGGRRGPADGLETMGAVFDVIDRALPTLPKSDPYLDELKSYHALFQPLAQRAARRSS